MKILVIRGKNLASLAGEFELNLAQSPIADVGLFAITGKTGSGKSTLLDAICLALFDRYPRLETGLGVDIGLKDNKIKSSHPSSIFRRGCAEAYAEVEFIGQQQQHYRSRWHIRRARGRAEGKIQAQTMSLERLSDHKVWKGKKTEVLAEIEQSLGLSFEQFQRSVLLAQGDFARFLKAKSDERASLLEKMTGANIYTELSILAHQKGNLQQQKLIDLEQKIQALVLLSPTEQQQFAEKLKQQQQLQQQLATQLQQLKQQQQWYQKQQQLQGQLEQQQQQWQDWQKKWQDIEQQEQQLQQASENLEQQIQQQQPKLDQAKHLVGQLQVLTQQKRQLTQQQQSHRDQITIRQKQWQVFAQQYQQFKCQYQQQQQQLQAFNMSMENNLVADWQVLELSQQQLLNLQDLLPQLQKLLQAEQHCPICGATEHPYRHHPHWIEQQQYQTKRLLLQQQLQGLKLKIDDLEHQKTAYQQQLNIYQQQQQQTEQQLSALITEMEKLRQQQQQLLQGQSIAQIEQTWQQQRQQQQQQQQAIQQGLQQKAELLGQEKVYQQQLRQHQLNQPSLTELELNDKLAYLQQAHEQSFTDIAEIKQQLTQQQQAQQHYQQLSRDYQKQQQQSQLWQQLKDVIGSSDGKKFRRFAQSLTLDVLLTYANHYLADFSKRYSLQRVPHSDLELQLVDKALGNGLRSVHSLSGGESFLVSLALALALASISSQHIQVESLFIDEGFGSLDSETLDIVLSVLEALQATGRQIGIVSHIPTLVERIGVQVKVITKTKGCSEVKVEYCY